MNDWYIFKGDKTPSDAKIRRLPDAPTWRQFNRIQESDSSANRKNRQQDTDFSRDELRGMTFEASEEEKRMVNAALYLRRPLLVTGAPGTGKSSLAYAVAYELNLGKVLYWPINTKSNLREGLYHYDAIGRLQDIQIERLKSPEGKIQPPEIGQYIRLGPLGTAFLSSDRPRVLLIDEIDKSDIDLPNDLLNLFEEGWFEIFELARLTQDIKKSEVYPHDSQEKKPVSRGRVVCTEFPLVIMTSNGERELPPAFLRRCLRLNIGEPGLERLEKVVENHFSEKEKTESKELIKLFFKLRQEGNLTTDQLLNAVHLTTEGIDMLSEDEDIKNLRNAIFQYLSPIGSV